MNKTSLKKHKFLFKILKLILIFLAIFMFSNNLKSQTTLNSNLYFINKYQLNPAYAGSKGTTYSILNYRSTNSYSQAAPKSFNLAVHSVVFNKMGAGIRLSNNKEGLFNNTNIFIDYSYKINLKSKQNIIFGISAGLESNQIDFSKIIAEDPAAIIDVASNNYVGSSFETSAGIIYNWNNLNISFSVPQLFENKDNINFSYLGIVSYNYKLNEKEINLKPSILLIKNTNSTAIYDINLQTIWKNQFWIALSYKNRPAFVFSAGVNLYNIGISYAIELGADKHSNIFKQIHEISIAYNFKRSKKLPNNNPFVNNDFELKNDSTKIKVDSSETIEKIIVKNNTFNDSITTEEVADKIKDKEKTNIKKNKKIKPKETGAGIYILNSTVNDSNNVTSTIKDSLLINCVVKEINNKKQDTLDYVEVSPGIFRIRNTKTNKFIDFNKDSISDSKLDSLSIKIKTIRDKSINNNNSNTKENENNYQHVYYTIRLYIDKTNTHLLYKPEIIEKTRAEIDASGISKYYYGQYSSKQDATKQFLRLKKLGIKNLKIKKISSFQ